MADTLTPNILLTNQTEGGNLNTWGQKADANFEEFDDKFGDVTAVSTAGGTTTLSDSQAIVNAVAVSGTLLSNATIEFPARGGSWNIKNNTAGAFTVTVKVTGQTGVVIDQGEARTVFFNGTDLEFSNTATEFTISGLPALTAPAVDDLLAIHDLSTVLDKKITISDFFKVITLLTAETAPAADDELVLYDASGATADKITLTNLFKVINALTAKTTPLIADEVVIYDAAGAASKKVALSDLLKIITGLTAETAPATNDELALYDASAGTADKITLENLFKVINALSEDTSPVVADDFVLSYDASAAAAKKVRLSSLLPARAYDDYAGTDSITDVIAVDDSKPQITEGFEILSTSITLRRSTSRVRLRFQGFGQAFSGGDDFSNWVAALFITGIADALSATVGPVAMSDESSAMTFPTVIEFEHVPGSVGPHTYSVRVGTTSGSRPLMMNAASATRVFGGAAISTLVVEEVFV